MRSLLDVKANRGADIGSDDVLMVGCYQSRKLSTEEDGGGLSVSRECH